MKATILHAARDIRVEESPTPCSRPAHDAIVAGRRRLRLRLATCGRTAASTRHRRPHRIGHEFVGIVEEVGPEVSTRRASGDFVIAPFDVCDGTCANCRNGVQHLVPRTAASGAARPHRRLRRRRAGRARAGAARRRHAGRRARTGRRRRMIPGLLTLSDVMGTGHHAAVSAGVGPGDTVAVVGDGAVGLCGVLAAQPARAPTGSSRCRGTTSARRSPASSARPTSSSERGDDGVGARCTSSPAASAPTRVLECVGTEGVDGPGAALGAARAAWSATSACRTAVRAARSATLFDAQRRRRRRRRAGPRLHRRAAARCARRCHPARAGVRPRAAAGRGRPRPTPRWTSGARSSHCCVPDARCDRRLELVADAFGGTVVMLDGMRSPTSSLADPELLAFEYTHFLAAVVDALDDGPLAVTHVGGAGLTMPRYVAATRPGSPQIVLEPDTEVTEAVRAAPPCPAVTASASRPPSTGAPGCARSAMPALTLVIVDAFAGGQVPAELTSVEWFTDVARVLRPAGVLAMNTADEPPRRHLARVPCRALRRAPLHGSGVHARDPQGQAVRQHGPGRQRGATAPVTTGAQRRECRVLGLLRAQQRPTPLAGIGPAVPRPRRAARRRHPRRATPGGCADRTAHARMGPWPTSDSPVPAPPTPEAPPLRWGILAPGWIARPSRRACAPTPARDPPWLAQPGARAGFATEFGASAAYGSYEELVADPDVDVVYVASPHSEHRDHALLAIEAGKPVLVEKAFARNAARGREVFDAASAGRVRDGGDVDALPAAHGCGAPVPRAGPARRCAHRDGRPRPALTPTGRSA